MKNYDGTKKQIGGYFPIAAGKLPGNKTIERTAEKYQASIPQLCMRYALQNGVIPLPKSMHEKYIIRNAVQCSLLG